MGRPRVQHKCRHCGKPCPARGKRKGGFSCITCAIERYEESHRQIAAGQGEYYDRWLEGIGAAIDRKRAESKANQASTSKDQVG